MSENPLNFYNILKTQLLKNVDDFIREIELSFDYIDKNKLNKTKKMIESCYSNDIKFKDFYNDLYNKLHDFKDKLHLSQKTKTLQLLFLNDIVFFDISFDIFKEEGKNTKKTLVNYLKEFYITSNFLRCITVSDNTQEENSTLFNDIQEMINNLTIEPDNKEKITIDKDKMINIKESLPQMDDLLGTLNNFMQNKEIMSLTSELTSELQTSDIDPMSMMNSLLSGNLNDSKFSSLLSKITDKITNKIECGDIDKNLIEQHANNFMNQITSNKDLMSIAKNLKM